MKKILHIDASGRKLTSGSRALSTQLVNTLTENLDAEVVYRDVSQGLPYLDDAMIASYFTPPEERDQQAKQVIIKSDQVVQELQDSDVIVIGVPMYNFAMPAGLKAWADLAARAGLSFRYTENGPVGLLKNKKAYVAITTGGVEIDSPADFLTPWLRQFLGFIGINDVTVVDASAINVRGEVAIEKAKVEIQAVA